MGYNYDNVIKINVCGSQKHNQNLISTYKADDGNLCDYTCHKIEAWRQLYNVKENLSDNIDTKTTTNVHK